MILGCFIPLKNLHSCSKRSTMHHDAGSLMEKRIECNTLISGTGELVTPGLVDSAIEANAKGVGLILD